MTKRELKTSRPHGIGSRYDELCEPEQKNDAAAVSVVHRSYPKRTGPNNFGDYASKDSPLALQENERWVETLASSRKLVQYLPGDSTPIDSLVKTQRTHADQSQAPQRTKDQRIGCDPPFATATGEGGRHQILHAAGAGPDRPPVSGRFSRCWSAAASSAWSR